MNDKGIIVASVDEMTGIQALERIKDSLPMSPGKIERREFEYIRHGTLSLIATMVVATGEIIPSIGPTRNEIDFVSHIKGVVESSPGFQWIFVLDQLNTHKSESLVKFVAEFESMNKDLGKKGSHGILENLKTREAFLSDKERKIRFLYVPKHTSWLNQIEIWFSILVRKLLKRASFRSKDEMQKKIFEFIDFFNRTMAKPFKWTYRGRPLKV